MAFNLIILGKCLCFKDERKRDVFLKKNDDSYQFDNFAYLNEVVKIVFFPVNEKVIILAKLQKNTWRY